MPAMPDLSRIIQELAEPAQLILLCHAAGADAASLQPLGERLREAFPMATIVSLQAESAADVGEGIDQGFVWFGLTGVTEDNRAVRLAQALPVLQAAVQYWQTRSGVAAVATALIGLSQGAEMVLEASKHFPMLASRVVAMGGRFTTLPTQLPAVTTIHLLHGKRDTLVPCAHTVNAAHCLRDLGCDITAEVVSFVGHELHPDLIELAITKLSNHIAPHLWTAAQVAANLSNDDQGTD